MAEYDKKEFAALCGLETKNLAVYARRGKVVVVDGKIDDKNPVNALFIEKRKVKTPKSTPVQQPKEKKQSNEKEPEVNSLVKAAEEKALLDLLKRQGEIDLQNIELQKKRGELVPVEAIKSLLIVHSESIKTAYVDASEALLLRISQRKQLTTNESVELRKELAQLVNKAIDDAISASKKTLLSVTQDFMRKRGVGQHD
jgi:formylmethanofuran dehydrogenase subunit D